MKVTIAPDFANLLPPLTAEELAILTANIEADPNHERMPPVILWKHKNILVDGHNQYKIRSKLNLKIKFAYIDPDTQDEALRYALDVQFGRRNLSESQRAIAYAKLPHHTHGGDRKTDQVAQVPLENIANLAGKAGVSERTMRDAIKVADTAPQKIVDAVAAGEIKVKDAASTLELTPKEQLAALTKKRKGEAKTLKQAAAKKQNGKVSGGASFNPAELESDRGPAPQKDEWDAPIQKHAAKAFEAVPRFNEIVKKLREAARLYADLCKMDGGQFLQTCSLDTTGGFKHSGITNAIRDLQASRPAHTLCPYSFNENFTHSKDCLLCHGLNWVPAIKGDRVPERLVKLAKKSACSR